MTDLYEPVQTAAYNSELFEKFVLSQQRIIEGTGPRMKRPGGGPVAGTNGGTVADKGRDSSTKLLARAEWVDCPAELCLPSDLCDDERSVKA